MNKQTLDLKNRKDHLDHVFDNGRKEELHRINKPEAVKVNESFTRRVVIIIAILLVGFIFYSMFSKNEPKEDLTKDVNWYTVKLVGEKIYYGQIADLSADPVVVNNVYYNYDDTEESENDIDTGNIRLVKRGKETHGPTGTMNIVRSQVVYMEPLADASKVLKAILEYEK